MSRWLMVAFELESRGDALPVWALGVRLQPVAGAPVDAWRAALRAGVPAVLARVAEGRLVLDVRTVLPGEEADLIEAMDRACR